MRPLRGEERRGGEEEVIDGTEGGVGMRGREGE